MKYSLMITTPSDREIAMSRSFDAPRELVFDAHTKPDLVKQWLGVVMGFEWEVCEIDLRVGGKYRYVWVRDQYRMGMGGEYLAVDAPKHVAATEQFDDAWYEGNATSTMDFTDVNGVTTVTMTVKYDSKEIRDKVLESPMDQGVSAGYDLLEKVLAKVQAEATV
jgi:uncharacterized protein YndB with AHSA1/START domain